MLLYDLHPTVERALTVLDHRTNKVLGRQATRPMSRWESCEEQAREQRAREDQVRSAAERVPMSRLLGCAMQQAVRDIDAVAKEAEEIVWCARLEVDALQEEYAERLVRAAQRSLHSDALTALKACRDQLADASADMWTLPEMDYLEPDNVPAMTVGGIRELLESARSTALYMEECYVDVIQKPYDIVLP
jgi:hypothetical protein